MSSDAAVPSDAGIGAIPPVILGTMTFADTVDEGDAKAILSAALDAGVTWIDTANVYAGGKTEEMLARLLPRDGLVLATKVGMDTPELEGRSPLSGDGIEVALTASLRRLRRDRVDLLYLHKPDYDTDIRETLTTIAALINRGLISAYGVSNYAAWQIAVIMAEADKAGMPRPVIAQQLYNPIARALESEYASFAQWASVPTAVYNPLAGGLLARRHARGSAEETGRFGRARIASVYRERYWNDQLLDASDSFADIADRAGIAPAEAALRWVAARPTTDSVIVGASSSAQLDANLRALAAGPLDPSVIAEMDAVGDALHGPVPPYNR